MAIIRKRLMIYLWMGEPYLFMDIDEANGNEIFDQLIAKGFIKPIYQNCSLFPDSCSMSDSVRSTLTTEAAKQNEILPIHSSNEFFIGGRRWYAWMINVSAPIIDGGPELFEKMKRLKILFLGRWQSSATHHIEVADTKILDGLKNMKYLKFLSLRGISLITELPSFISELTSLKILDLRACHNLEVIPDGIGLLKNLTYLDMSECYFLEYMPESLSNLSSLEVLKGFFVGNSSEKGSCTLDGLARIPRLGKLNIYTSVKDFPNDSQLSAFQKFRGLRKLTISWGGCSLEGEKIQPGKSQMALPSTLQKLDLQCFHGTSVPSWLRSANLKQLKKLYIRGGQLSDLGQYQNLNEEDHWNAEILRLKYLSELKMNWEKLMKLFPKLIYLHEEECPNLEKFPFAESGRWINIKTEVQAV